MNRLLILLILISSFTFAHAQKLKEENVPAQVRASFQTLYPDIKKPKWEFEKGKYEAEFRMDGIEQSALFDSSGTFLQMEHAVKESELPQAIKDYLKKKYPGQKIREANRITKANGDVFYEIEIKDQGIIIDSSGQLVTVEVD